MEEEILQDVCASQQFSLLCDESTDIAITNELVVYVRYIVCTSRMVKYLPFS